MNLLSWALIAFALSLIVMAVWAFTKAFQSSREFNHSLTELNRAIDEMIELQEKQLAIADAHLAETQQKIAELEAAEEKTFLVEHDQYEVGGEG